MFILHDPYLNGDGVKRSLLLLPPLFLLLGCCCFCHHPWWEDGAVLDDGTTMMSRRIDVDSLHCNAPDCSGTHQIETDEVGATTAGRGAAAGPARPQRGRSGPRRPAQAQETFGKLIKID
jgi:hypothetical protein